MEAAGKWGSTVDQSHLQKLEDVYLKTFNADLAQELGNASGVWDWPGYGVTSVSAVVIGYRQRKGDMEVVYLVTIFSGSPIPNAGQAMREAGDDSNCYTFVQLAKSVSLPVGYQTQLLSTYVGTNPYRRKPAVRRPRLATASLAKSAGSRSGPTLPHPPP
jgi:hypothetical protein